MKNTVQFILFYVWPSFLAHVGLILLVFDAPNTVINLIDLYRELSTKKKVFFGNEKIRIKRDVSCVERDDHFWRMFVGRGST